MNCTNQDALLNLKILKTKKGLVQIDSLKEVYKNTSNRCY